MDEFQAEALRIVMLEVSSAHLKIERVLFARLNRRLRRRKPWPALAQRDRMLRVHHLHTVYSKYTAASLKVLGWTPRASGFVGDLKGWTENQDAPCGHYVHASRYI